MSDPKIPFTIDPIDPMCEDSNAKRSVRIYIYLSLQNFATKIFCEQSFLFVS